MAVIQSVMNKIMCGWAAAECCRVTRDSSGCCYSPGNGLVVRCTVQTTGRQTADWGHTHTRDRDRNKPSRTLMVHNHRGGPY